MIGYVFQWIIGMLCGILVYELLKWLYYHLQDIKVKREYSVYEKLMFQEELERAKEKSQDK